MKHLNTSSLQTSKLFIFLAIAFGWTWLIGAVLFFSRIAPSSVPGIIILAMLYMPTPFVASLVAERGLIRERLTLPAHTKGGLLTFFIAPVIAVAVFVGMYFATIFLLGNIFGINSFGTIATTQEDVMRGAANLLGQAAVAQAGTPPPPIVLLLTTLLGAAVAGWTVNGLFALGEEYGWRGFLWEELRKVGVVQANILLGIIWGLWHAPLIVQGYNYPGQPVLGIVMMMLFAIGFSFVLTGIRSLTGSVLPAAAAHGMFNAMAVLMLMFLVDGNPIVAGPLGVTGSLLFVVIGWAIWRKVSTLNQSDRGSIAA